MMPKALLAGISYSDFWKMTISEIGDVLQAAADKQKAKAEEDSKVLEFRTKRDLQNAALVAYFSGYYSRPYVNLPESLGKAFPDIFKSEEKPSWEQTYMLLEKKRAEFMAKKKRKERR